MLTVSSKINAQETVPVSSLQVQAAEDYGFLLVMALAYLFPAHKIY